MWDDALFGARDGVVLHDDLPRGRRFKGGPKEGERETAVERSRWQGSGRLGERAVKGSGEIEERQ